MEDAAPHPTDADLCARVRTGDSAAFELIYRRHADWALGVATTMLGPDDAEDVVSETFAALLATLRRGHGPEGPVRAYLRTALRHQVHRRLKPTDHVLPVEDLAAVVDIGDRLVIPPLDDAVVDREDRTRASRAFQGLPATERRVLELVELQGMTYKEAAAELDVPVTTLGRMVYNARQALFDRWVAEHLATADDSHPGALELARYTTGTAPIRLRRRVGQHLADCPACDLRLTNLDIEHKRRRRRASAHGPLALLPVWWALSRHQPARLRDLWVLLTGRTELVALTLGLVVTAGVAAGLITTPSGDPAVTAPSAAITGGGQVDPRASAGDTSAITVAWMPGATLAGAQAGDEVTLDFRIRATGVDAATATLTVQSAPGVSIDSRYGTCTGSDSTLVCPGIGPFDDGQELTGQLVVRVDDPSAAALPTLSVTR
ncbi:sigma-70 family RNA polymerase sigma factor [Cellulomonas sp. NPDC089187]|uniref:RNA polymerase sigma factor n=1 Tax=Cellulomonas sp. NPDC089187 TaxID=3154970 RepID=UPI00341CA9EA